MENQQFDDAQSMVRGRIAQARARGPLGRAVESPSSERDVDLSPIGEEKPRKNAFETMRAAFSKLKELFSEASSPRDPEAQTEEFEADPSEDPPELVAASPVAAEMSPVDLLRRAQRANVDRRVERPALEGSPEKSVAEARVASRERDSAPSLPPPASEIPSLRDLLHRMGRREFCRIIGDTMQFDRASLLLGEGRHFVADESPAAGGVPETRSSFADQSALRRWCRMSVAAAAACDPANPLAAFEEVEGKLLNILYLDRKLRPVEPPQVPVSTPQEKGDLRLNSADQEARETFHRLLAAVGEPAFRRIVETPMGLACAKAFHIRQRNFLDGMPSDQQEDARPVPHPLYAELCKACHESVAARGVIETESLIFDVLSRKAEPQPQTARASLESSDSREKVSQQVDRHMTAAMDASWQPDPKIEDILTSARIDMIESEEKHLKRLEQSSPFLILGSGTEAREEWSPRAHDLRAAHDRAAGRPVDEAVLETARQESGLYRIWRAAVRALGREKPSVDLPPKEDRFEPKSEPVRTDGRIRNVRPGVYELTAK